MREYETGEMDRWADEVAQLEEENEELETQLSLSISMYEGDRSPMHNLQLEKAALKQENEALRLMAVGMLDKMLETLDEEG